MGIHTTLYWQGDSKVKDSFQWSQALSILVIGIGIGWLAGLTVSPVVGGIITSLVGIGAGVVTGLHAVRSGKGENQSNSNGRHIDARPAALLVLGIALSAPCGIVARTYHVFEPLKYQAVVGKNQSSSGKTKQSDSSMSDHYRGVLYGVYQSECEQLLSLAIMGNEKALIYRMKESTIPCAQDMVANFQDDPKTLVMLLKTICKYYESK
jgi:hypothetical protein